MKPSTQGMNNQPDTSIELEDDARRKQALDRLGSRRR
jgi:hypothetical protein